MAAKRKITLESVIELGKELRRKEIVRLQYDPIEAKRACNTGLKTVNKNLKALRDDFPGFEVEVLLLLPALCDELLRAQRKARGAASTAGTRDDINVAVKWRRLLLPMAQSLAEAGKVDAKEVQKIEKGSGASDTAQDVLDLVALLTPVRAAVETAIAPGTLSSANADAATALSALGGVGEGNQDAALDRDRLATLVVRYHERLRSAVAAVTSYNEALSLVPPLASGGGAKVLAPEKPPEK